MTSFTPESKKRMKELTKESLEKEIEIGAPICKTKRGLEIGKEIEGKEFGVEEIESCQVGENVGIFHTHPPTTMSGKVGLSSNDIEKFVDDGENWACLGGRDVVLSYPEREKKTDDVVRCYHATDDEIQKSRKKIDELWREEEKLSEIYHKRKRLNPYEKILELEI